MKKLFSFLAAVLLSVSMFAGGGIFEAWMTVQTNNEPPVLYNVAEGISLGTINQGKMDSVFIKVWKDNGTDITTVWVACKIDGGDPMEIPCQFGKNLGGNDQEWNAELNFNFLQGLADGDHTIELWAKAKTNSTEAPEYLYMSNDGANYAMTFTKGTPSPVAEGITVNVTVPEGTPACYFYGEMSGNQFVAMTKVDDTHYTIEFPDATSIGWGYKFVWESGNWSTNNSDPSGDIKIEPVEGVVTVEVKAWETNPPTPVGSKYFAKNNWNGAAADNWSWLEMVPTDVDNVYMLDTIVFGGTGVNINDKADDAGAIFLAADKIVVLNAGLDGIPAPYIPEPRKRDTVLYAPARTGAVLEAPTLQAGDTIKLFFNAADSTMSAFIIGRPAPAEEGFGIIFSDGSTIKGQKNDRQTEYLEYIIEANLTANATFQLYNFANKEAWTEGNIDEASTANIAINGDNVYEISADGKYTIYLKMFGIENNEVYVAYEASPSTGFNETVNDNSKFLIQNSKSIKNGRLFIIREGKLYNAHGAIIK